MHDSSPNFVTVGTVSRDDVLKLMLSADDARPIWAERGEKRRQWNSLTPDERKVVTLLLFGRTFSQLSPALRCNAREVEKDFHSALEKLGDTTPAQLLELHAAASFRLVKSVRRRNDQTLTAKSA